MRSRITSCRAVALGLVAACAPEPTVATSTTHQDLDVPPVRGSDMFCGNVRMWNDDCSPVSDPAISWAYAPYQRHICGTSQGVIQFSQMAPQCLANYDVEARYPAVQNVELRGWILPSSFSGDPERQYDDENEYHLDLQLDVGWAADPSTPVGSVTPINSLAALATWVPGDNIIAFGGRNFNTAQWGNTLWGGAGQAIVHIEVDGWGAGRGGPRWQERVPAGWFQHGYSSRPIYDTVCEGDACYTTVVDWSYEPIWWPADLAPVDASGAHAPLAVGEYVSVIGTLWRDGAHIKCYWWPFGCDGGAQNQAKLCFRNHTGQNYWAELHTPDLIRRVPAPPRSARHDVVAYAACSDDPATLDDTVQLSPPYPYSRIASVTPWLVAQSASASPPSIGTSSLGVHLTTQGATVAYYDVTWTCTPSCAGRCAGADDGCGGTCATSCPATQVCTAGVCGCPAGQELCPGASQCTSTCPAACGDGACNGGETCASCPADCGTCPVACPLNRNDCCGDGVCRTAAQCVRVGC